MAGMVKVVMTRIKHMAATKAIARIIGIAASIMARKGLPKLLLSSYFFTSSGVMLTPPEKSTKNITAAIRIKYIIQQ